MRIRHELGSEGDGGSVAHGQGHAAVASQRRIYIAAILTLAMTISFADRYVLAMLIQPIKAELHLSDTQIGLVTGFAFSAFYAVFGLIIARMSDRGWHRQVILCSLLIWSLMTALCGMASNFFHLLLARFGVGAGEAGVAPTSHATLAALFPAEVRTTALAVFSAGGPLGILIAFAVSGPLEQAVGWRWTFFLMALPGVILALIFALTVPPLPGSQMSSAPARPSSHTGAIGSFLTNRPFMALMLTASLLNLLTFGVPQWLPAFFERSHGIARAQLGPALAMTQGLGMLGGMLLGGPLADRLARRDAGWRMKLIALVTLAAMPFALATVLAPSYAWALGCAGIAAFLLGMNGGPVWTAVQDIAPPQSRATAAALVMMASAFIGMGCGPLLIGMLSDALAYRHAGQSLALALLIVTGSAGLLLLLVLRAATTSMRRIATMA